MIDRFYLGTHQVGWLGTVPVPLFVSHTRLRGRKTFPRALAPWACDSGAFTELDRHGRWDTTPEQYATAVDRYSTSVGRLVWAAQQDWLCAPQMVAHTGLSVHEHIDRTVANLLDLRRLAPHLPWAPSLQGWALADYQRCADSFEAAGVRLADEPVVGLGSIAPRQHRAEVGVIVEAMAERGYRLHGFGVKAGGLARYGEWLATADSMVWSHQARSLPPMAGHTHAHCQNCPTFAVAWRDRLLAGAAVVQGRLQPQG